MTSDTEHTLVLLGPERRRQLLGERLDADAQPTAGHPSGGEELGHDATRHVGRDGEADALPDGHDGGVDADHPPVQVEERTARVAGIDGGVGLDEALVGRHAQVLAPRRGDDADGDRAIQPERVADRDRPLADAQLVRIAQLRHRELALGLDLQHRQVGLGVAPRDLRLELPLVRQPHLDLAGVLDQVVVGEDDAGLVDDDARALAAGLAAGRRPLAEEPLEVLAEELPEAPLELLPLARVHALARVAALARAARLRGPLRVLRRGVDVDDGGHDPLRHRDERPLQALQDRLGVGRDRGRRGLRAGRGRNEQHQHQGETNEEMSCHSESSLERTIGSGLIRISSRD